MTDPTRCKWCDVALLDNGPHTEPNIVELDTGELHTAERCRDFIAAELEASSGKSNAEVMEYMRALGFARDERDALLTALGLYSPWPLSDVLDLLCDATDHLLIDHACDTDGYEQFALAVGAGRRYVAAIAEAKGKLR